MDEDAVLRVEIKNQRPVELADFTASMSAFAEAFKDYAAAHTQDPQPENMRLYVRSMQDGSIVAELVALAEQTQFILENAEVLAGFVGNLQDVISYFLGTTRAAPAGIPSTKQARQIGSIVEPIAKDSASQMNIAIAGGVHFHAPVQINLTSLEANAVQNAAARFLGPSLPASCVASDQLMTLDQVKNRLKAKTGDYGIIETITDRPVRLQFLSEEAKRAVLELDHENPLQSVFLVDVEVRTVEGKPRLYRIIEVKDVIPKD